MGDVIGGITGLIGNFAGQGDRDKATQAWQDAIGNYKQINPKLSAQTQISGDPRTQAMQNQILAQAMDRMRQGGLNAVDVARLNAIRGSQDQGARAGAAAAQQEAQAMGTQQGNSGILGALIANQGAANRASQEGMQAAAIGQQSQLENNKLAAGQAGALREQNNAVDTGNVERGMYQANQNKENEFKRAAGMMAGTPGLSGQLNSNAQNTAAQGAAMGRFAGNVMTGGSSPWTSWMDKWQGGG